MTAKSMTYEEAVSIIRDETGHQISRSETTLTKEMLYTSTSLALFMQMTPSNTKPKYYSREKITAAKDLLRTLTQENENKSYRNPHTHTSRKTPTSQNTKKPIQTPEKTFSYGQVHNDRANIRTIIQMTGDYQYKKVKDFLEKNLGHAILKSHAIDLESERRYNLAVNDKKFLEIIDGYFDPKKRS